MVLFQRNLCLVKLLGGIDMRKPRRENPELDHKSLRKVQHQIPKYYRAMLIELLDEPMTREKVLKYLDRFQYDPLIAGSGEKPERRTVRP